jgi:hypothetical protein
MTRVMIVVLLLASCGGAKPAARQAEKVDGGGGAPAWMEGAWASADGRSTERWHAAGGALFGVAFSPDGPRFEVMIVQPTKDGKLRFTAWPGGDGGVAFEETARGAAHVVFANPAHDFPREVSYRRDGDELSAFIGPGGGCCERAASFSWTRASAAPAPVLEQADRDFAAGTLTSLSAGWASWFDPEGAQWRPQRGRIQGPDAIRDLMRPAFDENGLKLEWTPRASGFSPSGELGFTIGDYVAPPRRPARPARAATSRSGASRPTDRGRSSSTSGRDDRLR